MMVGSLLDILWFPPFWNVNSVGSTESSVAMEIMMISLGAQVLASPKSDLALTTAGGSERNG
jgi:hypothetical protein